MEEMESYCDKDMALRTLLSVVVELLLEKLVLLSLEADIRLVPELEV